MAAQPLTREQVLEAAEDTLRRFGPAKTTVLDVARALGVSHGTVYRHFTSKAELRDAVLERWVQRINPVLAAIAEGEGTAADRLRLWLLRLLRTKHDLAREDPELFAAYGQLALERRSVVAAHVAHLTDGIREIVEAGMAGGEFAAGDPAAVARAVLDATIGFHHPAHAAGWSEPRWQARFDAVWSLLLSGLAER